MKKISGNKLFVKALKEEGVDVLFGYPGACTIDISDELYFSSKYARYISNSRLKNINPNITFC